MIKQLFKSYLFVISLVLLFTFVAAAFFWPTQKIITQAENLNGLPNPKKIISEIVLTENEIIFRTGKIPLPPHDHESWKGSTWRHPVLDVDHLEITIPEDGWITGSAMQVQNAPARVIHHVVLHNRNATDPFCPKLPPVVVGRGYEGFLTGSDSNGWYQYKFPEGYGYPVKKGDILWFHIALHNPDLQSYPHTSIGVRLPFIRKAMTEQPLKTSRYLRMFVESCQTTFPLPPTGNQTLEKRASFVTPFPIEVFDVAGHLHENGTEFWFRAGNKAEHSFMPRLNADGTFKQYDFHESINFILNRGDAVDLGVKYINLGAGYLEGGGTLYFLYTPLEEEN